MRALAYEDPLTDRDGRFVDLGAEVRVAAAGALGGLGDQAAEAALVRALGDPEEHVRDAAVDALADRGEEALERALRRLAGSMVEFDGELGAADRAVLRRLADAAGSDGARAAAREVADALGRGATANRARTVLEWLYPDSADVLLATLRTPGRAAYEAALALGTAHDVRAVVPLCELLRGAGDPGTRGAAAWALGMIRHPDAAGPLLEATCDDDYTVRSQATESFDRLGNAGVVLATRLLERPALEGELPPAPTNGDAMVVEGRARPAPAVEQPAVIRTAPVLRRLLGR